MAATIQTQPTPSVAATNNPQLKRIVYSKYRELLGSYNDKANAIIDSLPAYMVKEDRGFHFDPQIIDVAAAVDNVVYGTSPAPPPLSVGSLPSQRLSTQIPQYNVAEAPACVQNAMMTKDKKPFTYTPGGIDLSQIKSQRMAKRLARNAQNEGTTGQQQMHRPTQPPSQQQQHSNGGPSPGVVASQLGATAMGMPFQVLPTGPPPPPPQPGKVGAGAPPPPPPAPQQNKLAPQSNGNAAARRSPTPQKFEPPPMGFRPEIKIPPNPMASLKKVPPPQEKNNFWMEEYRKERSKSPMVGNDENDNNRSSPNNPEPETNQYSYSNSNSNQQNDPQPQYCAPQSPQPMRQQQQQENYNQTRPSPPRTPVQQQQQLDQQRRNESPYQTQYSSQQSQQSPTIQRQTSQYASPPQQHQQQNSPQQQSANIQRQISQQYSPQPQQQQQQSPTMQRQPSQQYQNTPQHSPQVQRQQSIPMQSQQQQQQYNSPQQSPSIQRQQTYQQQSPTSPQYQQQQQQNSPTQQQSVPWRQQKQVPLTAQNNVTRPRDVMSPAPAESPKPQFLNQQQQQQQQQYPAYLRTREGLSPAPEQHSSQMSQPYQQKNAQVGSIYIPPVVNQQQQQQFSPYQDSQGPRQQQQQQQAPRQAPTNRWMNAQGQTVENQTFNRIKSPPPPQSLPSVGNSSNGFGGNNTGLRLQINNNYSTSSNPKERIIPIQLEQTPTPTRTPASAPGFGPQPFYNSAQQQQYSSVPSPPVNQGTPNNGSNSPNYVIRSPNQFVDQGYNQYTGVQDHPTRVTSPQQQQQQQSRIIQQTSNAGGVTTRIIPIAIESQPDGPLNPNNARGPISQQPIVIQNDPRNQNTWGSGSATPTQSKSFRILQKITDTSDDSAFDKKAIESDGGQEQEPQLQQPTYARQMSSTGQINSPNVEQMKRMQLNNEQAYANRARNQEDDKKLASEEDPRYRGPSNPSKTFQKLQGAIERCSPCRTDANGTPPVMKQPQPNRYVSQRPVYSPDEHSQQYVHPSEQQVPEPKIYTGSAIPSRSFKILQAMTTPENAAESDSSDVVETDTSISECPCQQQQQHQPPPSCPYSYPYLPPCCTPPPPPSNSSSGGDISNWQYPYHHHPHSHHPHHHHHHHHPCSHHHPHQHPAYPYPPPCPCYFYNYPPNDYDSQNCSNRSSRSSISSRGSSFSRGRSQSQDLPKITITPSTDDVPKEINGEQMSRSQREGSVIDILSQKLSEISKPEGDTTNTLDSDKNYVGEKAKALEKSPTPTKSESENDKVSSDDSSEEMSSESEPSSSLSSDECPEERSNEGLKAIRSVSNIQFYNKKSRADSEDDDRTIAGDESMVFDEEEEEEIIGEELEYDKEVVLVEEIDSEECEEEEEQEVIYGEDEIIIMDDLSVIYEENESDLISPRPSSRMSSSVSETSTLANEEEVDHEHDINESDVAFKKEDDEEDNSNSVTVRLPLKFSFSRSSNDENIATVEVGNSEVEDRSRSFSIASVEAEPEDYESDSQDCDVSVTISLSRSSDSVDKKLLSGSSLSHISAEVIKEEPKEESVWESDDEDVSVSFSLPMRNKFMDQTLSGDLTNNISMGSEGVNKIDEERRISNGELEMEEKKSQTDLGRTTSEDKSDEEETETEREGESSIDIQDDDDEEEDEETEAKSEEELDFWETLQATRREAQMFLEKTAGYWGKSVDGKVKPDPTATDTKPIEEEKDEDFWSNIRVKKEEPKPKAPKLKKKKKVIKKVVKKIPEPEPEPEVKLTIVKLPPNINNKSKVVESAIQMIQEKTKKPKKLVKQVSKEEVKVVKAALENEIVQITKAVEEEKKLIEEAKTRRASLSMAKSIDEPKIEEVKKEEIEDRMSKYVREKAELKTQILNQKFAKAFVIPNKPPLMKGVLSEAECEDPIQTMQVKSESSISTYCEKSKAIVTETAISTENIKIEERKNSIPKVLISHEMETAVSTNVIKEPKKLIKKKITKAKAIDEDCDGNMLKPPAKKTVKKSTSTKKIKKKKEDIVIDVANTEGSKENENKSVLSAKITSEVVEEKTEVVVQEETTVVMQKPSSALEGVSAEEKDFWAEIEISKSSDNLRKTQEAEKVKETDPWASVQVSKESEDATAATTQETDPWIGIESISGSENLPQTKSVDEEPDFWAVIDAAKTKIEQSTLVESSKIKTQQKVTPKDLQLLQWCNVESFATTQVKITEVVAPKLMNGCRDYWLQEIEKPEVKKEESPKENISFEIEKGKSKLEEVKPKKTVKKSTSTTDTTTSDASSAKPKIKRKTSLTPQEDTSSSQTGESVKLKTVRKSSITKEVDSTEAKPKTKKKTSTPEEESTFPVKPKKKSKSADSGENGEKRSSIKLKSKKKLSETQPEKETSKSTKACSLKAYSDYDIELVHGEPEPVFYPICSQLDTGISFWATVSYTKEEEQVNEQEIDIWAEREAEGNSEIDTGKIDFWVTQRKFQTTINLNGDNAPKNIEEPGEDFWADIQDNPAEDKTPEKIEEVDFWANNRKPDIFVENNYPMKTQNQANDADYRANNRKSDNFVETPAMIQNQSEEVDFWANNRNTDHFVENNYPMKTQNQANAADYRANNRRSDNIVETPAMIQSQAEEVDFWVNNRKTDNFVEPRNTMKTQDQSRNVHNWVNSRNNDNFVENRSPVSIQDQPDNILVNNLNRNTANTQVQAEKRDNFGNNRWTDNLVQNRLLQENQANEVDFWANNRNTDTFAGTSIPVKNEEPAQEVDFWAEIKGPNEEPAEDDCELRRNNYKKAMAFFTNTVSVEKKEKPEKKFVPLTDEEPPSRPWRPSVEPEWIAPNEQNEVALIVEDTETTEDEPETLVENTFYILDDTRNYQQNNDEEESQSSESISDSTPNHFQIEYLYPKPEPEAFKPKEKTIESGFNQAAEDSKISVKDRIFAFETGTVEPTAQQTATKIAKTSLSVEDASPNLSRNSSQRSESEIEEDDSGVTDMNKPLSETDTESESFPELRKMTPYQRASTHSRLFKLLQDDEDIIAEERPGEGEDALEAEFNFKPRKKIVHNVSITRKQNPNALQEAETVSQRRQRLSLPLRKNQSIDADNPSTPNSPASPIQGQQSQPISDKLVNELIQSLLLKKSSSSLKNLPMEKLQAAAKRVLEEELDSLDNTSLDSTPALTPQEFKNESYADYYDTWNSSKIDSDSSPATNGSFEILPSKAFKVLQETAGAAKRKPWGVRCPRVLSSKTVNRDLARVTESPEMSSRSSRSPEMFNSERACSVGRWKKV